MPSAIPKRLDRYLILDEIGRGAMGVVYLARDPLIGRLVALKTFQLGEGEDPDEQQQARERFIREAQSAGILSHPNIVTIHDVVEGGEDRVTFIAMEYVEGTNLKEMLKGPEAFELPFVADVVWQVAEALEYAHSKGVVHRDIKPANILVTDDRRVKLTDFGIARLGPSNLTYVGQLLGTPNYMAPEQVQGQEVDHRADIFALGVVLYEMLTRNKPFQGDNLTVVSHAIVHEPFVPLDEYLGQVPDGMRELLARALAKSREERFQGAGELARQLKRVTDRAVAREALTETQEVELPQPPPAVPAWRQRLDAASAALRSAAGGIASAAAAGRSRLAAALAAWRSRRAEGSPAAGSPAAGTPPPSEPPSLSSTISSVSSVASAAAAPVRRRPPLWRLALVAAVTAALSLSAAAVAFWAVRPSDDLVTRHSLEHNRRVAYLPWLFQGRALLRQGDPAAAVPALRKAERLAPDEPLLRRLRQQAEREATALEERREEAAALLEKGREAAAARRWQEAREAAQGALELLPDEEEAQQLLASAEEALERQAERSAAARRAAPPSPPAPEPAAPEPADERAASAAEPSESTPASGPARLVVRFESQEPEGVLTLYAGQQQLLRESFRFVERSGLFRSREVPGGFERTLELPPGSVELRVYVTLGRTLSEELQGNFTPGVTRELHIEVGEGGSLQVRLR